MKARSAARGADLVGLDFAAQASRLSRFRPRARVAAPLLLTALVAALGLAALRVDLLRVRYALADAVAEEQALLGTGRELTVEMRRLRHPSRLAERAAELGFARPERVVTLPAPSSVSRESIPVPETRAGARP